MELDVIDATTGLSFSEAESPRPTLVLTVVPSDYTEIKLGDGFAFSSRLWQGGHTKQIPARVFFRTRSDLDGFLDEAVAEESAGFARALLPTDKSAYAELTIFLFASDEWIIDLSRRMSGIKTGAMKLRITETSIGRFEELIASPDPASPGGRASFVPICSFSVHITQLASSILEIRDLRAEIEDQRRLEDADTFEDFKKRRSEFVENKENADPILRTVKAIRLTLIAILFLQVAILLAT